jgi:polysaccharide pyruvyl transferase WcaK-like protein
MAAGILNYKKDHAAFTILIAMEMLDSDACNQISEKLGGAPIFSSEQYNMYELVSILRSAHRVVSSRYHAIVTSMPAAIPSIGITMDERIRNLMRERGHEHLLMTVDDAEIEDKIPVALEILDSQSEQIRFDMERVVAHNLQLMAKMGVYLEEQVARTYPEFPIRTGVLTWEDYLPPLGPCLRRLIEKHESVLA